MDSEALPARLGVQPPVSHAESHTVELGGEVKETPREAGSPDIPQ